MSAPVQAPRNAPCPCGSGRRYKDCHGALGATQARNEGLRTSIRPPSYRPVGPEWEVLGENERDRLAQLMERALTSQEKDMADAERLYREVLAVAPQTHDALHMLGVVRWLRGDLIEAQALIERAIALREPYPEIRRNLINLKRVRDTRSRHGQERLAEAALPWLLALLGAESGSAPQPPQGAFEVRRAGEPVHIILNATDPDGDAAWVFERLAGALAPWNVVAWRNGARAAQGQARRIDEASGVHPRGGIQIHVGLDMEDGGWLERCEARRIAAVGIVASPSDWLHGLRALAADGHRALVPVFTTSAQAQRFGVEGPVLPLLGTPETRRVHGGGGDRWTVGLFFGDGRRVRAEEGVDLIDRLIAAGRRVAIYDPGRLRYALGDSPHVRFVSRRTTTTEAFLDRIDALLMPDRPWHQEGLGRELIGAMQRGLPVVCPQSSIHAVAIRDGIDGMLAAGDDQTFDALERLARDRTFALGIGAQAALALSRRADSVRVRNELAREFGLGTPERLK